MKKSLFIALGTFIIALGSGCTSITPNSNSNSVAVQNQADHTAIQVAASFYPMAYFAEQIGGDLATVTNLTPAGAEPHDYELTPNDIATIQDSQLLVLNGAHFEPWSEDVLADLPSSVSVVSASDTLATLQGEEHEHEEGEEHAEEEHEEHEEGEVVIDPHVWLSPVLAKSEVKNITSAFVAADPANAATYTANSEALQARLDTLDTDYKSGLAKCTSKDIITSHAAFAYTAAAYGLTQQSISGLTTEAEPSLDELAELSDYAKENNVKYIFFESLVSPALSETLADEVGAQTLVLNPIEGLTDEEIAEGQDYFTVMQSNLANLRTALECQ